MDSRMEKKHVNSHLNIQISFPGDFSWKISKIWPNNLEFEEVRIYCKNLKFHNLDLCIPVDLVKNSYKKGYIRADWGLNDPPAKYFAPRNNIHDFTATFVRENTRILRILFYYGFKAPFKVFCKGKP